MLYVISIFLSADEFTTRSGTPLDLVLEARPCAVLEKSVFTLTYTKYFLQDIQTVANRVSTWKRPKVFALPFLSTAME
jgi:hypothetical protein